MAANKFATMVHRNTNKITLILVYALLEWILILLLLLNSLFSYLILKFSDYFGLKRPCLLCSRLDHVFDPGNFKACYRDLVCESHATEISQLGFCTNHRRLAESRDMCEDCLSSLPQSNFPKFCWNFSFMPWMKQIEAGEVNNRSCSCCGVVFETKFNSPYLLIKPALKLLECAQKENLIEDSDFDHAVDGVGHPEPRRSESLPHQERNEKRNEQSRGIQIISTEYEAADMIELETQEEFSGFISSFDCRPLNVDEVGEVGIANEKGRESIQADESKGISPETLNKHLEFYIDQEDCHLIPVETATPKQDGYSLREEDQGFSGNGDVILDFELCIGTPVELVVDERFSAAQNGEAMLLDDILHRDKSTGTEIPEDPTTRCAQFRENDGHVPGDLGMEERRSSVEKNKSVSADDRRENDGIKAFELKEFGETITMGNMDEQVATLEIPSPPSDADNVQVRTAISDEIDFEANQVSWREDDGITVFELMEFGETIKMEDMHEQVASLEKLNLSGDTDNVQVRAAMSDEIEFDVNQVSDEHNDEMEADVSIGTEIPDHESVDDIQTQEVHPSSQCIQEDPSSSSAQLLANDGCESKNAEEELVEFKTMTAEMSDRAIKPNLTFSSELNDIEEDKVPETPTSIDSLHQLHKKLLLLERKETGTEESLDGSVISDMEGGEVVSTVEKLKLALKSERKALNALYVELEEERSASAVAASQTMAMINRLQEEKAAMQMEALQYQRMMEEQSEYDQEALQLLNELMIKREKEKAELEKELEIYRKKVQDYEARERLMVLRRRKDSSTRSETSASCSNAEDSDGLSVDLNLEPKAEDKFDNDQEKNSQNTPADAVLYLEESLANFEEERLSILEQLKVLEEKLVTLNDEDEQEFEDVKAMQHTHETNGTNGYHYHNNSKESSDTNGVNIVDINGSNGNHQEETKKMTLLKAKSLLPLFDATDAETEDLTSDEYENGYDSHLSLGSHELPNKRLAIEEEVDHVYDRLQALEADREFLKHCISSLRKGDKGIYLLQEILQHLRDLRNVEFRARAVGDGVM